MINDCGCVLNAMAQLCFDLGATIISCLNFSNWIYYFIFYSFLQFSSSCQFVLLNVAACHFGDNIAMRKLYMTSSYYYITFLIPCSLVILSWWALNHPTIFKLYSLYLIFVFTVLIFYQVTKMR